MEQNKRISKSDLPTLKWLWNIFHKERWHVFVITITCSINAVLTIVFADCSKKIINAATEEHSLERVVQCAINFLILIMVQLILTLITRSFNERCKARIEVTLRKHILDTIIRKDYQEVTKYHTGEIQNRMTSDVETISYGFTSLLPNLMYFVLKLLCAFIYLVVIDKLFTVVFLVAGLIIFLCSFIFRGIIKKLHKRVQESEGRVRSYIQEILTSLLVVKSFDVEDKVTQQADILMENNYKIKMKRRVFGILSNAGISTTFNLGYVFALAYGAYRLVNGIDYGTVVSMLQLVNQIQQPFASLSNMLPNYFGLLASAERIIELDKINDEFEHNNSDINAIDTYDKLKSINFENITFGYDRDVILDNTSLKIDKGDFVAIMGISGIGKSTLLKLLLGVFRIDSGSITLDVGNETIPVDCHTRKMFSYVPQGNFLLSGSIRDNLTFINSDVTDEEIKEAVRISCADQFVYDLPQQLDTVIGEHGIGLSEGQLQRLAIARSILSKSPIMLLDEATSALDEATELRFLKNLKEMQDKTCIIVSHKTAALEICNKHIKIIDSKIVLEEK
ncbi:ABC transporter ATP-binding protein [uncultured Eubacterium sp.]|uniref:ABC transporter ATP-binding protein n=1 Tax=uncultured Eubacterium sp. TaxID=165185 RepID=UPI0025F0C2A0|nr:ABC transporter ATP-binding protein [uncultured Eubacterium sp.]